MGVFRDIVYGTHKPDAGLANSGFMTAQEMKIMEAEAMYRANIGGLMAPQKISNPPAYPKREDSFEMHPIGMISMRLHFKSGDRFPLPHIDAYVTKDVAVVFAIDKSNRPVIIEDDPALFPSDTLITQLRLLIG